MTILQIKMMLHYFTTPMPYGDEPVFSSAPAVSDQREALLTLGLVERGHMDPKTYRVTARGRAYVMALQAMPLPDRVWRVRTITADFSDDTEVVRTGPV